MIFSDLGTINLEKSHGFSAYRFRLGVPAILRTLRGLPAHRVSTDYRRRVS
ncbi:hypothetical protein JNB88_24380 [Rhizobium cauense]|nr:hypothetical protein [Rhizobium cauense]